MNNFKQVLRGLIKIAGKILFVIGLVLNICMVFFGFWPSLIYILLMIMGLIMIFPNKDINTKIDINFSRNIKNTFSSKINKEDFKKNILFSSKVIFIGFLVIIFIMIAASHLLSPYYKRKYTVNDCQKIIVALDAYKKDLSRYPKNMDILIGNNPLRKEWRQDRWNNNYFYKTLDNGNKYILISMGNDEQLNTNDDIIFKN